MVVQAGGVKNMVVQAGRVKNIAGHFPTKYDPNALAESMQKVASPIISYVARLKHKDDPSKLGGSKKKE